MPLEVQGQSLNPLALGSLAGLGRPAIGAALVFAALGALLCLLGALRARRDLTEAGIRAAAATAGFTAFATFCLLTAFFAHDFSIAYVASYSSRSLTGAYTFSALWGGMEGSLLLWALLLTVLGAIALRRAQRESTELVAWAGAVVASIACFFLLLLALPANPFARLASAPVDGQGLNPLLQSPGMLVHPPLLYLGFVGFSIPFAYGVAALASTRLDDEWLRATRRWTLLAWSSLSIGIVLGGAWAYTELGWGGYWAWDPVENASFMPWLTATAYLHSIVIQEKRRMLKVWNLSLILLTYVLAVFGTFLTRSGILSSIHTFSEGSVGKYFLPYLALVLLGGIALIAARLGALESENRLDSLLSRESAFMANNVLFLAAAFTVLWGTVYPIVNEWLTGLRLSVGPPFFNRAFVPIGLAIVALTGLGPLISWRRMRAAPLLLLLRAPLGIAVLVVGGLGAGGVDSFGALLAFGLCAFTAAAILSEFVRGSRVHRRRESLSWPGALSRTVARNRRRYGGYVVHLGVVLIVIGFAGGWARVERSAELRTGDSLQLGDYTLTYDGLRSFDTPEKQVNDATIRVARGDEPITVLHPQRNFHLASRQTQSEVAIRTTPLEDLYVVVTAVDADSAIVLRAFVNPLTWWIWAGAVVMLAGMGVLLSGPSPVGVPVTVPRRLSHVAASS